MGTQYFLPGEFHGQRTLARYSPWVRKESDMTECLTLHIYIYTGVGFLEVMVNFFFWWLSIVFYFCLFIFIIFFIYFIFYLYLFIVYLYLFLLVGSCNNWRLITLQYCSGFVIHRHESAMDIHVFPIPIPPPTSLSTSSLWVFPVHQARALVSRIRPGLVICFTLDNIHVSMLFSRNIPPLPSPTECKSLFCTSVSLFLFCI